jgi:integrase
MKGCRPLSSDEIKVCLDAFGGTFATRDRALFLLQATSGFRISELLALRVRDVRRHGRILPRVRVQRRHMKKKIEGRTVRVVPLAQAALDEWIEELQPERVAGNATHLFLSRKGRNRPITRRHALRIYQTIFEELELDGGTGELGTHSLRKSFAVRVYEATGRDLLKTQQALGHKSIQSTISYLGGADQAELDSIIDAVGLDAA